MSFRLSGQSAAFSVAMLIGAAIAAASLSLTGNLSVGGNTAVTGTLGVTGATTLTTLSVSGATTHTGATTVSSENLGVISPAAITGTMNDWSPTGLASATVIRIATSGNATINGITGGVDGRVLIFRNIGANSVTFAHEAAASTAANRFSNVSGANAVAGTGTSFGSYMFVYSSASSRWEQVDGVRNIDSLVVATTSTLTGAVVASAAFSTVGNATLGNANTNMHTVNGHLTVIGTAPTPSACGTTPTIAGSDLAGRFVTGSATGTACVITFSRTFTTAPACTVTAEVATQPTYTVSATAITLATTISSTAYHYHCECVGGSCT